MGATLTARIFQSTHLLRGATICTVIYHTPTPISIHAPLARCDIINRLYHVPSQFQSTHLLRGATVVVYAQGSGFGISIHAPLARCDRAGNVHISTGMYFNPRTSCEVRQNALMLLSLRIAISIHAPLARCDSRVSSGVFLDTTFQSTHLLRGATEYHVEFDTIVAISIHAPLARCDFKFVKKHSLFINFNPRTSCEVRPELVLPSSNHPCRFQSTHLLRGATLSFAVKITSLGFQSTHLLRGATASVRKQLPHALFQSTHLLRGATTAFSRKAYTVTISIHAPLARCDKQ